MDIVYNLKKFFSEQQDEAAIPGLGVFFKALTDENGKPIPEEDAVIQFIEKTPRSNAFVNFLGYEENLTESDAVEVIERWVATILSDLKTRKVALIPELGTFEIKKDKVIFKPAANQNLSYTGEEYGLGELPKKEEKMKAKKSSEKPVVAKKMPKQKVEKKPMDRTMLWTIISAALVVLIVGGIACYKTIPQFQDFWDNNICNCNGDYNHEHKAKPIVISPVSANTEEIADEVCEEEKTEEIATPVAETSIPETEKRDEITSKTEVVASPQTPVKSTRSMPFNVIGGSFSVKQNADKFSAEKQKEGYTVDVIFDNNKQLYLVSLGGFCTMNEALKFKENIRQTKDIPCWIFER